MDNKSKQSKFQRVRNSSTHDLLIIQQVQNWFGNHSSDGAADSAEAAKCSQKVVGTLFNGAPKVKNRKKLKPNAAYNEMFRERLQPLLQAEWKKEKESKGYVDDALHLAFRNDLLNKMLNAESQAIKDKVELFRDEDLKRRREEDTLELAGAELEIIRDSELTLPKEEWDRLALVRSRHR